MHISRITHLTVRWLNSADDAVARTAAGELVEQMEHWLSYAAEMLALEDEILDSVIQTEARGIMARMQGYIR